MVGVAVTSYVREQVVLLRVVLLVTLLIALYQPVVAALRGDNPTGHISVPSLGPRYQDEGQQGRGALDTCPAEGGVFNTTSKQCSDNGVLLHDGTCLCAAIWSGSTTCDTLTQKDLLTQLIPGTFGRAFPRPLALSAASIDSLPREAFEPYEEMTAGPASAATLRKLIKRKGQSDPFEGKLYRSCAVVANSGALLLQSRGSHIDRHDAVFRFNSAPTRRFERHVGTCTTHRLVRGGTITGQRAWSASKAEIMLSHAFLHGVGGARGEGQFNVFEVWSRRLVQYLQDPDPNVYVLSPEWSTYMDAVLTTGTAAQGKYWASTGLVGVWLALHKCAKVKLYGFYMSSSQGVKHHYWDTAGKDAPMNRPRDDFEYAIGMHLVEAGLVEVDQPCLSVCHYDPVKVHAARDAESLKQRARCAACQPHEDLQGVALILGLVVAGLVLSLLVILLPVICCLPEAVKLYYRFTAAKVG